MCSPNEVANLTGHLDAPGPAEAAMHDILHHLAGQDARLPLLLQQQRTSPQQLARLALLLYHDNTRIWILQASERADHGETAHSLP